MIGGNTRARIETATAVKDAFGMEQVDWTIAKAIELIGYLDMTGGGSDTARLGARLETTTDLFLCDWRDITLGDGACRMVIGGRVYDIVHIDNPMGLNDHLEIYLKYTGAMA